MLKTLKRRIRGEIENIVGGKRRKELLNDALDFAESHKDVLVFMADKRTDDIIAVYNTNYSAARIRSKWIKKYVGVIDLMLFEEDKKERERRLHEFLGVVDAFLWNLTEKLVQKKRSEEISGKIKKYAKKKEKPTNKRGN